MVFDVFNNILPNSENPIFRITDNLELHFAGYYIVKYNKRIFLTPTENKLLLFFCMNPNRKISLRELLEYSSKNNNTCYIEQNIYINIKRLRLKIENNPKNPELILNIRPGYIFNINQ